MVATSASQLQRSQSPSYSASGTHTPFPVPTVPTVPTPNLHGPSNEEIDDNNHELPGRHFGHSIHDQQAESSHEGENSNEDETSCDKDNETILRHVKCCSARQFLINLGTLEGQPLYGSLLGRTPLQSSPQMAQPDLASQIVETSSAIWLVGHFDFILDLCKGAESYKYSINIMLMWCGQESPL